jgi:hypothetical protein
VLLLDVLSTPLLLLLLLLWVPGWLLLVGMGPAAAASAVEDVHGAKQNAAAARSSHKVRVAAPGMAGAPADPPLIGHKGSVPAARQRLGCVRETLSICTSSTNKAS